MLIFLCLLIMGFPYAFAQVKVYTQQPTWGEALNFKRIEEELRTEPIVELKDMRRYLQEQGKETHFRAKVYVATLGNGLKAVFKPATKLHDTYGALAAYRASIWLGQYLVPPLVLREYDGKWGSLQFFVESPFDLLKSHEREIAFSKLSPKVLSDRDVFYLVFKGRVYSHAGNQVVSLNKWGAAFLALIDNASFMTHHKKREFPKTLLGTGKKYPLVYSRATLERYKQLTVSVLRWIYKDALNDKRKYCSPKFFKTILNRRDQLLAMQGKVLIP